ncbi:hypothetical protein ACFLZ2_01385 [Candidatus Margulisiibacteriota bacterium]
MKNRNLLILIFVVFLVISAKTCVFAAWDVDIDADYSYNDKVRNVLIAKGHVKAKGKDFYLESPYVKYYYKENKIVAEDRFFIDIEGYRVSGSKLEYYYRKKTGVAGIVRINFGNTFLGGSYMTIGKGKMKVFNAYFTGCNAPESHYHVSANELVLYPKTGLIVAYWSTAWVGPAPVIPVPTFVFSTKVPESKFKKKPTKKLTAYEKKMMRIEAKKKKQPVPELATNSEDGFFLAQGFNWYLTPRTYAKFLLRFTGNKGMGMGLRSNYIINDVNEGEVRLGKSDGDGDYGGFSHYYSFGPKIIPPEEEEWLIYDTYKLGGKYAYEIEYNQSNRERINLDENKGPFNRVSFSPMVTLRSNRQPLPYLGLPFTYYMEANTANVTEEPTSISTTAAQSERQQFYMDITYDTEVPFLGDFSLLYDVNSIDYITVDRTWQRSTQRMELIKDFGVLEAKLGHVHYIHQAGTGSPFAYETYDFSPFDQLMTSFKANYWWSSLKVDTVYDLPQNTINRVNYALIFGMHCYDLVFTYDVRYYPEQSSTFMFTFDLTNSRWIDKPK